MSAARVVVVGLARQGAGDASPRPVRDLFFNRAGVVGDQSGQGPVVIMQDWAALSALAAREAKQCLPGVNGEHVAVHGLNTLPLRPGDRLAIGPLLFEVSAVTPGLGIAARVLRGGAIRIGGWVRHEARRLRVLIITLSDRASRGIYSDRSGPKVQAMLEAWAQENQWGLELTLACIPDDADAFRALLQEAQERALDLVVSTGSTGVGPRDVAPEVVTALADKLIPGIMEQVRFKYGQDKPMVRLSRSVAAVLGESVVLALPGSPRAVEEYLCEIAPLLEHLILSVHGAELH